MAAINSYYRSLHKNLFKLCIVAISLTVLNGCNNNTDNPNYQSSDKLPEFNQKNFDLYLQETRSWIDANRIFKSKEKDRELLANLPYEVKPNNPNGQGVLLVHGLADSPFSFIDVANHLADKGYLVRAVLLPGHGSKVGDLMLPSLADWQNVVAHHSELLKQRVEKVWLGGYSTGANLVTSLAIKDDEVAGLLLFSPAFKPDSFLVSLAPIANYFTAWADQDPEDNYIRYNSLPMNAAVIYNQTSQVVRSELTNAHYKKPVFMMMSEADSVIDTAYAKTIFTEVMTNTSNQLIWEGEVKPEDIRSVNFSMDLPAQNISNGSHQGILFSPENPVYGRNGEVIICSNGQTEKDETKCNVGNDIWFSAYGYRESGKVHARMTWNPYFDESMLLLDKVMQQ